MSQSWKEFTDRAKKAAGKAATKIEQATDTAALYIKSKNLEVKLCEAYEKLGRHYYTQLDGQSGMGEEIDRDVAAIDKLKAELDKVRQDIAAKQPKEEPKEPPKAEATPENEASQSSETTETARQIEVAEEKSEEN